MKNSSVGHWTRKKEMDKHVLLNKYEDILKIKSFKDAIKTFQVADKNTMSHSHFGMTTLNPPKSKLVEHDKIPLVGMKVALTQPDKKSNDGVNTNRSSPQNNRVFQDQSDFHADRTFDIKTGITIDNRNFIHVNQFVETYDSVVQASLPAISRNTKRKIPTESDMLTTKETIKSFRSLYSNLGDINNIILKLLDDEEEQILNVFLKETKSNQFFELQKKRFFYLKKILDYLLGSQGNLTDEEKYSNIVQLFKRELEKFISKYIEFINLLSKKKVSSNPIHTKEIELQNVVSKNEIEEYCQLIRLLMNNLKMDKTFLATDERIKVDNMPTKILELKTIIKAFKDPQYWDICEELNRVLRDYCNEVEILNSKITRLETENQQLKEINSSYVMKAKRDNMKIIEINKEIQQKHIPTREELTAEIEKSMQSTIKSLEKENKDLTHEQEKLKERLNRTKEQLDKYVKFEKQNQKNTANVEVQVSYIRENINTLSISTISSMYNNINSSILSGVPQSKEWVVSICTAVFNEKLIADFIDDFELRPRVQFKKYVLEWFFKKFGNFYVVELLLKDFFVSLKTLVNDNERFMLFADFCGIEDFTNRGKGTTDAKHYFSKSKIKHIFLSSTEAMRIYLKMAFKLQELEKNKIKKPFLPNICIKGSDLIHSNVAKTLMELTLTEEGFQTDHIIELLNGFRENFIQYDLYHRVMAENGIGAEFKTDRTEEENWIRFDFFAQKVLYIIADFNINKIDHIFNALQVNHYNRTESNISFEYFRQAIGPNITFKTSRWMEKAYQTMMDINISQNLPLSHLIYNLLPCVFEHDSVKSNYLEIDLDDIVDKIPRKMLEENIRESKLNEKAKEKENNANSGAAKKDDGQSKKKPTNKKGQQGQSALTIADKTFADLEKTIKALEYENKLKVIRHCKQYFDAISSLSALQESYNILKSVITTVERNNENVVSQHQEFNDMFSKYPSDIAKLNTFDDFVAYSPNDLFDSTEKLWEKFREIISICYKN